MAAHRRSSSSARGATALLALLAVSITALPIAQAYTDPNNYNKLVAFRDSMKVRSANWQAALQTWTCPTPPANSVPAGACDPCGQLSDGNWYHMHCRGNSRGWGESGDGTKNGITTNMHITSSLVDGPVPKDLCVIPTLREHDFGGQLNRGHLTGPWPSWLGDCYPDLEELDLSNNRLTGTLPPYLGSMKVLTEIKFENNGLIGTIPSEIGNLTRLRRFQPEFNNMRGPIPQSFKNVAPYLTQFHIARNNFEGDLSMLAGGHITTVTVHDNPKLCGMVPATVRFAKGYNPGNTGLGKPCPGAAGAPAPAAAAAASPPPASPAAAPSSTETSSVEANGAQNTTGTVQPSSSSSGASGSTGASPAPPASPDVPPASPAAGGNEQQGSGGSSTEGSGPSPVPGSGTSDNGSNSDDGSAGGSSGGGDNSMGGSELSVAAASPATSAGADTASP